MDWTKLIDIVIWPVVTVTSTLLFKKPLSEFIGRIREVGKEGMNNAETTSR